MHKNDFLNFLLHLSQYILILDITIKLYFCQKFVIREGACCDVVRVVMLGGFNKIDWLEQNILGLRWMRNLVEISGLKQSLSWQMKFGKILKFWNVRTQISGPMFKGALFRTFFICPCQTELSVDRIFIEKFH